MRTATVSFSCAATPRRRARFSSRLVVLLAILAGCQAAAPPPTFDVVVAFESDPGQPIAGATVHRGGTALGQSDAAGEVPLTLAGRSGDVVGLRATCPAGHRSPSAPLKVVLRTLADAHRRPRYEVSCPPELRSLVVAVRATGGQDVPVRYRDRIVARTDAAGTAHVNLKVAPEEQVTLVLDTSAAQHRQLRPKNPEFTLVMPPRDEIAVFEQTFEVQRPRHRAARPSPNRPQRITRR